MKMKHVHGMIIFGIICSILPIPFYAGSAISGNLSGFGVGIAIQVIGAILITMSRVYHAKLKNAPST